MIAIIDYGAGNLFSVKNALDFLGLENKITNSAADLSAADRLILPGVGAFPDAMRMLGETGLIGVIKEEVRKKPLLGICLGMQMLFEKATNSAKLTVSGLFPEALGSCVRQGSCLFRTSAGTHWRKMFRADF